MSELLHQVSQTLARMEQEQARRLNQQDLRLAVLERQVKGCQDLQNELEQVLKQLADFSRRWRK